MRQSMLLYALGVIPGWQIPRRDVSRGITELSCRLFGDRSREPLCRLHYHSVPPLQLLTYQRKTNDFVACLWRGPPISPAHAPSRRKLVSLIGSYRG
ncbi:hypothetical protein BJX68DRAFT_244689 [Aspergillus pseudodeflectus]|uniref:Secreted protein n=1 Tax=Aspergillus pseudodeflectus TaxID=176178 RepID=A0ABR4JRH4_9EURO